MVQRKERLYSPEAVKAVEARGGDVMVYIQAELFRRDAWSRYKRVRASYMRAFVDKNEAGMAHFGDAARKSYLAYVAAAGVVSGMTGIESMVLQP